MGALRDDFLREVTVLLAQRPSGEPVAERLCRLTVDLLRAVDGSIAVTGAEPAAGPRSVLCASSEPARRFEDAQDLVHEGPAFDVLRAGSPVSVDDVAAESGRWPRLLQALGASGVPAAGLEALPMRDARRTVGVLSVHRRRGQPLGVDAVDLQFVADTVGAVVMDDLADHRRASRTWSERDLVDQATGMVVAQLRIDPDDALAVLRAHAFAEHATLAETARRVVSRELHFRGDREGHGP